MYNLHAADGSAFVAPGGLRTWALASLGVLCAGAGLFFVGLGDRELYSSHEARAAMNAVSLLRGAAIPHLYDDTADLQKPPTYYALVAVIGAMRGEVDGWAVRLPAALAGWGILALLLGFGWYIRRPHVGLFAALCLLVGVHFPWLARIGRIDMPLAFCVTLSALSFWLALRGERGWLWSAYGGMALGFLLKGPIGLALPMVILLAWLAIERRWPTGLALLPGMLGVAAVTLPLYLWMQYASDGRFFHEFFWLHNVQRGLGGSRLRSHPWWLYGPYLLLYLLPVSPLLLVGCFLPARRDAVGRAGLAWLGATVLLLSLARFKRADYLLPVYPGAALFLGVVLEHAWRRAPRWVMAATLAVFGCAMLGWFVYLGVHLPAEAPYRDYRPLAARIRAESDGTAVVYFQAETHALMFRVGQPAQVLLDWPELREAVRRPRLVVVQAKMLDQVRQALHDAQIDCLTSTEELAGGRHERPLVLLRVYLPV
jgi:4-amino-4-deoxy-L-arabinose transferase-like glycosyltransferase